MAGKQGSTWVVREIRHQHLLGLHNNGANTAFTTFRRIPHAPSLPIRNIQVVNPSRMAEISWKWMKDDEESITVLLVTRSY